MNSPIRVAFFTDSFFEPNGVATLSREYAAFAKRHEHPFLCVHSGNSTQISVDGSVRSVELRRGPLSFPLDQDLYCDPLLSRYLPLLKKVLRDFSPDLIHITGPGDMGILGAFAANRMHIPLVASWHTNLHEYAGRRVNKHCAFLPAKSRHSLSAFAERSSLTALMRFYRIPRLTMAPNPELVALLEKRTGKPSFLMRHGVDLNRFHPTQNNNPQHPFTIGYVGRLTPEKNVRLFALIEASLLRQGITKFRLLLVGDGSERAWLTKNLKQADMPGVLRGDELAMAYAAMDVFVFPSETDTFGLVILEAMATGIPVVVARGGGPQFQVAPGVNGLFATDAEDFATQIRKLIEDPALCHQLGQAARRHACLNSWDGVFTHIYDSYRRYEAALYPPT